MFPEIRHIDDLRSQVSHLPEIRFQTNEFGFTVVCYMIATADTFTGEHAAFSRECRGITFAPDGKIASRPLHKFFNVGELPETLEDVVAGKWDTLRRIMDKRDGSMLHPIKLTDGSILLKTKKSFTSDVALSATKFVNLPQNAEVLEFCRHCVENDWTPVFEYTSPKSRIVLAYGEEKLVLLHVRDNITGEYFHSGVVHSIAKAYGVEVVDEFNRYEFTFDKTKGLTKSLQDVEGFVMEFADGSMMKWKTDWYFEMHHAVVFVRERDIAEMVLSETVDDYKSYRTQAGMPLEPILEIERRVLAELNHIQAQAEEAFAQIKDCVSRKEAALKLKGHKWFSAAMDLYNGKEFDVKYHFERHVLKEKFSLDQI